MKIQVLPPFVAEKIAAGEVIERPSSIVKELVENSLDAGATEINVILKNGGINLIEVIDNGCGMHPEDLELSVKRHATSKISSINDLEKIKTLGFRGEALASITAVAELSMISRTVETETAYEIRTHGNSDVKKPEAVTFGHFLGSPHGTRIQVEGLFAQIPARLKFLKSPKAELTHVREWLERLALANPQTGFSLKNEDKTILNLRPQEENNRAKAILADEGDYPLISMDNFSSDQAPSIRLRAHWLQGMSSPQTRKLIQIVNGRAIRDRLLMQAALAPFRQLLMPGQFPVLAIFVDIDPSEIDVNVHPTKTEIRFYDTGKIFREIRSLLDGMIAKQGAPAFVPLSVSAQQWTAQDSFQNFSHPITSFITPSDQSNLVFASPNPFHGARFAGMVFNTYILYDHGDELILLDQHAAHERVRYETLRKQIILNGTIPPKQELLLPESVHIMQEEFPGLESRLKFLEKLGFGVEIFSESSILFRAVPAAWGTDSLRVRLKNLIDKLMSYELQENHVQNDSVLMDEQLFETLASEACHSAVRAGDSLERSEAEALIARLFDCEHPWNCPHGRPTVVKIPRGKFEEWFQRKI